MNECLENIILVRRLWNVEKDVQPGELLNLDRKSLLCFVLERALLPGDVLLFVEHICKWFLSVLS